MDRTRLAWLEDNPLVASAVYELVGRGVLEPVELGTAEERLWSDCDLAIFAEHRLGDLTDPRAVDAQRRADWVARATTEAHRPPSARPLDRAFWICAGGEHVGSIALARSTLGGTLAYVSSLYVWPAARRRGHARSALTAVHDALAARGLGLRLETCWAWQGTLRAYLHMGMVVRMWKRDLTLLWSADPREPIIDVGPQDASLSIAIDGRERLLTRARRDGDRLVLEDAATDDDAGELLWELRSTFALELAMHGWPLIRSQAHWEQSHFSDLGPPEALAYKIEVWEAWDRAHGWIVDTPRIPALEYPTWAELQAKWAAAAEAIVHPKP